MNEKKEASEKIKQLEVELKGEISSRKIISFSFGYLVISYMLRSYSNIVFYFYEVEIGLPVVLVGIAFVIFAIWNMINDPLVGFLTDKPMRWTKKWGLHAPWVVITSIPILICYFLIFTPPDIDMNENALLVFFYMVLITCLFDLLFSIYNIHVYSGFTYQFRTEYQRRKSFAFIAAIAGIGVVFIDLIPPFVIVYGDRSTFMVAALIVVMILIACNLILFLGVSEPQELKESFLQGYNTAEKQKFFIVLKKALGQKNFLIMLITYTLIITSQTLGNASRIYIVKDILGKPYSSANLINLGGFIGYIISIPFWVKFSKKYGFKRTYEISLLFSSMSYIAILFITTLEQTIIWTFLGGIPFAGYTIVLMPMASDTSDEIALAMGKRLDATLAGIRTFFYRIAIVFQGVAITLIHLLTEYDPDPDAIQTPLAIWGIRIHAGLIPVILMFSCFLIVYKWYDLIGKRKEEMIKKLIKSGL